MSKNIYFKIIILSIYFFFTILSVNFQHYEYTFKDTNNTKEYKVFSEGRDVYIRLENEMLTEGQFPDFKIQELYEDKDYFIGCDFNDNSEDNIGKKYYIVVDKNKAIMKIYKEQDFKENYKNIDESEFKNIYTFLKRKGTKFCR